MTNQNTKTCEFSLSKYDTEYLYAFLETIPENLRGKEKETHKRVLEVLETELQKHQLNWLKEKNSSNLKEKPIRRAK